MRIDLSSSAGSQISSDVSSKQVGEAANSLAFAKAQGSAQDDRATLSSDTASLSSLTNTAMSSPEIRQGRVDNLKQAIGNGEYNVDAQRTAASMVGESA